MHVVVVGATGNIGTSLLSALSGDPRVDSVVGIARRLPRLHWSKVGWCQADIRHSELASLFEGADAVIHLAWALQPSHDLHALEQTNVAGSSRVFAAALAAGVPKLIYASSVGAYSPGPKDRRVDESWATGGIATSFYSRHKASVERALDELENSADIEVARIRPGLVFKREAGPEIRRLFAGPFLPTSLAQPRMIPLVPSHRRLCFQALHSLDAAEAFRLALHKKVRGAFNIAAEPVLDPAVLGRLLSAVAVPVQPRVLRGLVGASWKLRLQPSPPGWLDLALGVPIMDTARARAELRWSPRYESGDALLELLDGLRANTGLDTPPLDPDRSGRLRVRELIDGIGAGDT